ncbi:NAD(P)-dependent malic enzyme [Desulforudis sp. DRI-14]|uniref:NAD(P)-dependent malic enzyme n=1 Tax=Desulforudis sp. DRI-14 TaxID=3459793 RepID=UPI004041CD42
MPLRDEALELHRTVKGKIEIKSKLPLRDERDLSLAYTPGVAAPCEEIYADRQKVYEYTAKGNLVAVVSNGSAVLGLGNIGPEAALPVMEGKAILFKTFGGVDAVPICIDAGDAPSIIETVRRLAPTFGGINLEDIAAPLCFEVEAELKRILDIPVFHDDQHGTAVVVTAGLLNALTLTGRTLRDIRIVINGAGSAGLAITRLLLKLGVEHILVCDRKGIIYPDRAEGMNSYKQDIALRTNGARITGTLADALAGADVFIGVSKGNQVAPEMINRMAPDPIIFALANPDPEIWPDEAAAAGAAIIATGRSDFPNQINNVLAFPGIFRGALDVRAIDINDEMKLAAARAIASLAEETLKPDHIIPEPFDSRVAPAVAEATAKAAIASGVARVGGALPGP